MKQKFYLVIVLLLALSITTKAFASLTFSTDAITGTTASTIDVGAGNALNIQTVGNGAVNLGTGTVTAGGDLAVTGVIEADGAFSRIGPMPADTGAFFLPDQYGLVIGHTATGNSTGAPTTLVVSNKHESTAFDSSAAVYGVSETTANSTVGPDLMYGGYFYGAHAKDGLNASSLYGSYNIAGVTQNTTGTASFAIGVEGRGLQWGGNIGTLEGVRGRLSKLSGTTTNAYAIRGRATVASGGTFTNYAMIALDEDAPGTNNAIALLGTASFPAGNWALYSNSTRPSVFSGKLTAASIDLSDSGAKPTCDTTTRGTFWVDEGGAGVSDTVETCIKNAADAYVWQTLY